MLQRLPPLSRYTMLTGVVLVLAGLLPLLAPTDLDLWWHLRTGQLIAEQGVPTVNDYSFTEQGRPWVAYHWLLEWLMYVVQGAFGYGGLVVLFGLVQAVSGWLVYRLCRFVGARREVALGLLLVFVILAAPTWGVRPQIVAALFLASYYLILLTYRTTAPLPVKEGLGEGAGRRVLWLLPPLSLVWANMHGTYVTGLIVIGIFLLGEAINNFIYRPIRPTPLLPLVLALAGSAAATLVNPYFVNLWLLPLGYVPGESRNPLFAIDEWLSPDFHDYANLPLVVSFVVLMIVGVGRGVAAGEPERWRLKLGRYFDATEVGVVAAFTWLGLQGAYTSPLYGVMVLPLLAAGLTRAWHGLAASNDSLTPRREGQVNWLLGGGLAVLLVGVLLAAPGAQTGWQPRLDGRFRYPAAAADYLLALPPETRIFNEFGVGGYLIYRLYPQHRIFIDGRVDVYRGRTFDDYFAISGLAADWRARLARYGVNTVVVAPNSGLAFALAGETGWSLGYRDDVAVVYRKR